LQHSQNVDLEACGDLKGQDILIVGGGLTSAHLSLGAIRRGAQVTLLIRRNLRSKPFDADPGWLGPKYLKAFHAEPCMRRRQRQVLEARDGGSITPETAAQLWLAHDGQAHAVEDRTYAAATRRGETGGDGRVRAAMNGRVVAVLVGPGEAVQAGQPVLTLEAMKMEHVHHAGVAGVVAALHAAAGDQVAAGRVVVEISPAA
jgi:biotin carboxyl carrier protein